MTSHNGWCVYLLECLDGTWYAGITNDLERRFKAHVAGKGARYTRARKAARIIAFKPFPDRAAASKAEFALKQLPKHKKCNFLGGPLLPN